MRYSDPCACGSRDALERPQGRGVYDGFPLRLRWRTFRLLLESPRRVNAPLAPLFDPATGIPTVAPHVVGEAELRRLRSAR